jgi:hypothetical protein
MSAEIRTPSNGSWMPSAMSTYTQRQTGGGQTETQAGVQWLEQNVELGPVRDKAPVAMGVRSHMRRLAWRLLKPTFEPYFRQEQDVLGNLVRVVAALTTELDAVRSDQDRSLAAVESDLVDLAGHLESMIAGIGGRA